MLGGEANAISNASVAQSAALALTRDGLLAALPPLRKIGFGIQLWKFNDAHYQPSKSVKALWTPNKVAAVLTDNNFLSLAFAFLAN